MPWRRLPGIGVQVPLFVALPSSLPEEKIRSRWAFSSTSGRIELSIPGFGFRSSTFDFGLRFRSWASIFLFSIFDQWFTGKRGRVQIRDGEFQSRRALVCASIQFYKSAMGPAPKAQKSLAQARKPWVEISQIPKPRRWRHQINPDNFGDFGNS